MTTAPLAPEPALQPGAALLTTTSRARTRGLRAGAALAAGTLLTAVLGLSAPAVASASTRDVALVDAWSQGLSARGWGAYGGSSSGGSYGGSYGGSVSGSQSSSVDSDPATSAESKGVALIDTVLPDGEAAGTGIVLTSDGEVLTNYHVVEGSTSVKVTLPSSGATTGRTYTATVVGADQSADVALLQLRGANGLATATIDDDTLAVGDDVTAVGNAGGTGSLTAADGEVTDLSASITTQSEGTAAGERLTRLIETSADVVPGDSGGPLLDSEGEVVGIDTAASSGQEIDGYAVPIATALAVVTQIRSGDETSAVRIGPAAFLGVEVASSAVSDSAYGYGYGSTFGGGAVGGSAEGATIAGVVDGGAAAKAGLAAGDAGTRVGSTEIAAASDLTGALAELNPGDRVKVTWTTADGSSESATVTLGSSPVN
jgi:S1-C subfamily serine protease